MAHSKSSLRFSADAFLTGAQVDIVMSRVDNSNELESVLSAAIRINRRMWYSVPTSPVLMCPPSVGQYPIRLEDVWLSVRQLLTVHADIRL